MKTRISIYSVILVASLLFGCTTKQAQVYQAPRRIILKETTITAGGRVYQILEIDGVEYVANSDGGICPLVIPK